MELDVLIFGGGAAGLWLLDQLTRRGDRALLLEAGDLGAGQTVASQGILHGGLKYTLQGLMTSAAREVRDMPGIWRDCLTGHGTPDLRQTRVRSDVCHLWNTDSLKSRLGMFAAKVSLQVAPVELNASDRPEVFAGCAGPIFRLDEQVIAPSTFIADLARQYRDRILKFEFPRGLACEVSQPGCVSRVVVTDPDSGRQQEVVPRQVVLTAGAGNAALRKACGLTANAMQRRPLHMVMVRGDLPVINGHCVDGARTRVTITSDVDAAGRIVWQVGGQIAEDGVALDEVSLIHRAHQELQAVLPALDLSRAEWATYRVDRAEFQSPSGKRPDTAFALREGNTITAWPTKLVLAPQLAKTVAALLPASTSRGVFDLAALRDWPRPERALPPWEMARAWHPLMNVVYRQDAA